MPQFSEQDGNRSRSGRRFRPTVDDANDGGAPLDRRLLLSGGPRPHPGRAHHAAPVAHTTTTTIRHPAAAPQKSLNPVAEINVQYAQFLGAFNTVLEAYVTSLEEQSTNTLTVNATVTTAYTAGSPVIEVDDAAVFGPEGTFNPSLLATATLGTAPPIGHFTLTGRSQNSLTINVSQSSLIPMTAGTVLTATVPTSSNSSAASIFPNFVTSSTIQLSVGLVSYFNNLNTKLPAFNAPPHTPVNRGAIQTYIYQTILGSSNSLQQLLLAIPLPTTAGADLDIYKATVASTVEGSRSQLINGIQQIWAGRLSIPAPARANRLGINLNSGSGSSTSGSTSGSGTSSSGA
jgi:hypothetical protein